MNKKYYLILFLFSILLAGCRNEPMIQLNEENQAIAESKRQESILREEERERQVAIDESQRAAEVSEDSEQSLLETNDSLASSQSIEIIEESQEVQNNAIVSDDWENAVEGTTWDLSSFVPYQENQIRQFQQNLTNYIYYVDFMNEVQNIWQVRQMGGNSPVVQLIAQQNNQLLQVTLQNSVKPFVNYISTLNSQLQNSEILLQAPVTVGTSWTSNNGGTSEITGMYNSITFGEQEFTNVVEVTTIQEQEEVRHFYSENIGYILSMYPPSENDESATSKQVTEITDNVQVVVAYDMWQPNEDTTNGPLLVPESESLNWQTNSTTATIFTQLFRRIGWIDESVSVNNLSVIDNTVTVDFTPGIVAVMNSHPRNERGVIPAIVASMVDMFNVDQVRLTVNNNGLLPDFLPYPSGGLWQVDPLWFQEQANQQAASSASSISSSESSNNDESTSDESISESSISQ